MLFKLINQFLSLKTEPPKNYDLPLPLVSLGQAKLIACFPFQDFQNMMRAGGHYSLFIMLNYSLCSLCYSLFIIWIDICRISLDFPMKTFSTRAVLSYGDGGIIETLPFFTFSNSSNKE